MSDTQKPTRQDDMIRILRILSDAPAGGFSLEEIQKATEGGEKWSLRTINDLLCGLSSRVRHEKIRTKSGKVTKYQLRSQN